MLYHGFVSFCLDVNAHMSDLYIVIIYCSKTSTESHMRITRILFHQFLEILDKRLIEVILERLDTARLGF